MGEMAEQRAATLDALVDVNHRLRLEGEELLKPGGEELEMSDLNGVTANTKDKPSGEEPEAADKTFARRASRWGLMQQSQTANFTHFLGEFRPEYAPPPPVRHWAPPPQHYAPPSYPQQWGGYQGHAHPAHVAHPTPNQGYSGYSANPGYGSHIPQSSHRKIPQGSFGQGAHQPHGGQYGNPYGSQRSMHGPPNASGKG